jgi:hypothetical protein
VATAGVAKNVNGVFLVKYTYLLELPYRWHERPITLSCQLPPPNILYADKTIRFQYIKLLTSTNGHFIKTSRFVSSHKHYKSYRAESHQYSLHSGKPEMIYILFV